MIIYQSLPCRLYPDICNILRKNFINSYFIHDLFDIEGEKDNEKAPRIINKKLIKCTYGIFDTNKVQKGKNDFWFTIKNREEDNVYEYYAAINYFSSLNFLQRTNDIELYSLHRQLRNIELEDFIEMFNNDSLPDMTFNGKIYSFKKNLKYTDDSKCDYIGYFDNIEKVVDDLKKIINLDLSELIGKSYRSYKKQ
jgi:hypothetical protein